MTNAFSKNSKDAPVLLPDQSLESFLEDLDIWYSGTDLDKKKVVAYMITVSLVQSPIHHRIAKQLWRRKKTDYEKDDGYKTFVKDLKSELRVGSFSDKSSRVIAWLAMVRQSSESYKEFVSRFKNQIDILERDSCALVKEDSMSYLMNIRLFAGLRLTSAESQILRAVSNLETDKHSEFLQKIEDHLLPSSLATAMSPSGEQARWAESEENDWDPWADWDQSFWGAVTGDLDFECDWSDWAWDSENGWSEPSASSTAPPPERPAVQENQDSEGAAVQEEHEAFWSGSWSQDRSNWHGWHSKGKGKSSSGSKGKGKKGKGKPRSKGERQFKGYGYQNGYSAGRSKGTNSGKK